MKRCLSLAAMIVVLGFAGANFATANTFVFSHLLEQSGTLLDTQNTFDTTIFVAYTEGQGGVPADATASSIDIFIFDEVTGDLLLADDGSTAICAPCNFPMGSDGLTNSFDPTVGDNNTGISPRKRKLSIEQMIKDKNGGSFLSAGIVLGYVIAVTNGNVDAMNLTSAVVNARSGPADLAVFVFEPQPIAAAAVR